jgi:hypothetical protein
LACLAIEPLRHDDASTAAFLSGGVTWVSIELDRVVLCQSASKRAPLSADKRDPFRRGAGTMFRREVASASVPTEAARRDDCLEFSEIEVVLIWFAHRLPNERTPSVATEGVRPELLKPSAMAVRWRRGACARGTSSSIRLMVWPSAILARTSRR